MFHVSSLLNLKSDLMRPPTVRCQVMNMVDEITAKMEPSSSCAKKFASLQMTCGSKRELRK